MPDTGARRKPNARAPTQAAVDAVAAADAGNAGTARDAGGVGDPAGGGGLDASRLTHLVGYAASRAAIVLRKVFTKHLGPLQLKVVEFSILMLVAANPRVNQKQLGQALDLSAPNMAVTLDRMVERGWIERVRSTEDRRAMLIHLTSRGRELLQRAEKISATMENPALRMLSGAERALLIELLLKVAAGRSGKRG